MEVSDAGCTRAKRSQGIGYVAMALRYSSAFRYHVDYEYRDQRCVGVGVRE